MILLFRLSFADASGNSSEVCTRTRDSSSDNMEGNETVFEIVLDEMKKKGFEVGFVFALVRTSFT